MAVGTERVALTDDDIRDLALKEINQADTYFSGDLSDNREDAMEAYLGMRRGDEIEGKSNVISTDVSDTIEWLLPQIIKALGTPSDVVSFNPLDSSTEEQAELESKYVSHMIKSHPNSYETLYAAVKDALMQKNGVVKSAWVDEKYMRLEDYEGLDEVGLYNLMADAKDSEITIINQEEVATETFDPATGVEVSTVYYNLKLRRTWTESRVDYVAIPPEQFIISRDATSIDISKARFSCHKVFMTASELIEQGVPVELVEELPPYTYSDDSGERETRRFLEDEATLTDETGNFSTTRYLVYEGYLTVDRDGDGIAELIKVRTVDSSLIDVEEVDINPFSGCTAFLLSHKFYGLSIYDKIIEIQDNKTAIWRQIMDNLFLANNQRHAIVLDQVNMEDMLNSRAGGIVRVKSQGAIQPLPNMPIGVEAYQMLEEMDKARRNRAGADGGGQAFNVGNDTAHGIERMMTAGEELQGLLIRTFAETLSKSMATITRFLISKHGSPTTIQVDGEWKDIDPREWNYRSSLVVKPILGLGDRSSKTASMREILIHQERLASVNSTLVSKRNQFAALQELIELGDVGIASKFFQNPDSPEGQQAQQAQDANNQAQSEQSAALQQVQTQALNAEAEANMQIAQLNSQIKLLTKQVDAKAKSDELVFKYDQLRSDATLEYTKMEIENRIDIPDQGIDGPIGDLE